MKNISIRPGRTQYIGVGFLISMGAFGFAINLFINDKLRAEMESIISSGRKKEELKIIHDRLANNYDKKTDNYEIRNQFNKYRRILVSYAKGKVLELGVGTGRSLEFYKEDADVLGIDYSPKMLEAAKSKLDDRLGNRIKENLKVILTQMDCEDIKTNFPENYFDSVVDINNFMCYNDYMKVYDGIKYVLKDQGVFLFMAKGESSFFLLRDFMKMIKPYQFMKKGQDPTTNWSDLIEKDPSWEILYKEKKNNGTTYIYILKLNKNNIKL